MAYTGNTQQNINYGSSANDGQGDPLRSAFIKTDDNFDAVWATGPVGSNITIVNTTVQVMNTNGNLILRPNGVGVIQANAAVVPNATDLRDLGTANLRFRAAYIGTGGLEVTGNVTIQGSFGITNLVVNAISSDDSSFVTVQDGLDVKGLLLADAVSVTGNVVGNNVNATTSLGLPVYANATVRDGTITSPQSGMMIFVTGTGLQVRGATAWNTVTGTAT